MISYRDMTSDDLPLLVRWRNDPAVAQCLGDRLKSLPDAQAWLVRQRAVPEIWLKMIEYEGRTVGYGAVESIDTQNRRCELALVIGEPDCWGKGIARVVMREMLHYAFVDLKLHRVFAAAMRGNERSVRLITGSGFRQEGVMRESVLVHGDFVDLLCFSLLEEEYLNSTSFNKQ